MRQPAFPPPSPRRRRAAIPRRGMGGRGRASGAAARRARAASRGSEPSPSARGPRRDAAGLSRGPLPAISSSASGTVLTTSANASIRYGRPLMGSIRPSAPTIGQRPRRAARGPAISTPVWMTRASGATARAVASEAAITHPARRSGGRTALPSSATAPCTCTTIGDREASFATSASSRPPTWRWTRSGRAPRIAVTKPRSSPGRSPPR